METDRHVIAGVHITDRVQQVSQLQTVLSSYGFLIKTRLGLHETSKNLSSPNGVILLELLDDEEHVEGLISELSGIEGVEVQRMVFDNP